MAQTLHTIRNKIKTSIHGRRLGLTDAEMLAGVKDIQMVVTDATSDTTGTNLPNHGLVSVVTTTNDSWILTDPIPGVSVQIVTGTSSTGIHTILSDSATFNSSESSTGESVVLTGGNAGMTLRGLTTAIWVATSRIGTTAASHVSS